MTAHAATVAASSCTVFDLSGQGLVEVAGPEAAAFLHNLCTNDIRNLDPGRLVEAFFATAKGRALAHVHILRPGEGDRYLVNVVGRPGKAAAFGRKIHEHLDRHLISERAELADRTGEIGVLRLVGPRAAAVVEQVIGDSCSEMIDRSVRVVGDLAVRRLDEVQKGFDLLFPLDRVEVTMARCLHAGASEGDEAVFEILRVETGTPAWGKELDENRLVMEINRAALAISYTKGCYLGQETIVMARDRGQVNRLLMGLVVEGEEPLAPGAVLKLGDQEVGQATSSLWSPRLGRVIGLGYVKRGLQEPGTVLRAFPPEAGRAVTVSALPFSS